MIDSETQERVIIRWGESAPGLIMLPFEQLDTVVRVLDANAVFYWVDEEVLSVNGGPETAFITISRRNDMAAVQRLLDSIP